MNIPPWCVFKAMFADGGTINIPPGVYYDDTEVMPRRRP